VVPLSERLLNRLPENWQWIKDATIAGNEVWRVAALFLSLLLAMVLGRIIRLFVTAAAKRSERRGHHLVAVGLTAAAKSIGFAAFMLGLTVGVSYFLILNDVVRPIADTILRVLWTTAIGFAVYQLVDVVDEWLTRISARTASRLDDMLVPLVSKSLRATIIVLVLVQIATYLAGQQVTSIIAGLGVGGLAVGLAAQDTIKNIFGSMMIFGDRPFELGDEISLGAAGGNIGGVIEAVGFRSTRFRNSDGHLVTIPNGDLANKTIINISRQPSLVRKFTIALKQDVAPEKAQRAVEIIKQILSDHEGMKPNKGARVFLQEITPQALVISIQYWYHPADNLRFAAFNERINLEILRRLAAEEIALQKA